jgi:hypothetical protein
MRVARLALRHPGRVMFRMPLSLVAGDAAAQSRADPEFGRRVSQPDNKQQERRCQH